MQSIYCLHLKTPELQPWEGCVLWIPYREVRNLKKPSAWWELNPLTTLFWGKSFTAVFSTEHSFSTTPLLLGVLCSINNRRILGELRFEPGATGSEAQMLPLCYSAHLHRLKLNFDSFSKFHRWPKSNQSRFRRIKDELSLSCFWSWTHSSKNIDSLKNRKYLYKDSCLQNLSIITSIRRSIAK